MLSFKKFVEAEMVSEPVPPGVDPEMWSNPSYQKFWKAQNQQQNVAPKIGQQQVPQTKPYQQQKAYQDMGTIETGIKTYMSKMPGMPSNGTLRNIPDPSLVQAVGSKIRTGEIPLQPSAQYAMAAGRGVHFYQDKNGNYAFFINR